jgi:hypothetical protein
MVRSQRHLRSRDGKSSSGDTHYPGSDYSFNWQGTWPSGSGGPSSITATVEPTTYLYTEGDRVDDHPDYTVISLSLNYSSSSGNIETVEWLVDGVSRPGTFQLAGGEEVLIRVTSDLSPPAIRTWEIDAAVAYTTPVVANALADQTFDRAFTAQTINFTSVFTTNDPGGMSYIITGLPPSWADNGDGTATGDLSIAFSSLSVTCTATNADGVNSASDSIQLTVNPVVPATMDAPSLVVNSFSQITATLAPIPDDGGSPITQYDLRYRIAAGAWTEVLDITSPYAIGGLQSNTEYEVQIRAVNAVGNAAWSVTATANTLEDPGVPAAMAAPSLTADSESQITVTLASAPDDGGSPITQYDLRYRIDPNAWTEVLDITSPYAIVDLDFSTEYEVQTRAVNAVGDAAWSVTATATTLIAAPNISISPPSITVDSGTAGVVAEVLNSGGDIDTLVIDNPALIIQGSSIETNAPAVEGTYPSIVTATNNAGSDTANFTMNVNAVVVDPPTVLISPSSDTVAQGTTGQIATVTFGGGPADTITLTGTGAQYYTLNGTALNLIGGTPAGVHPVTITVNNASGVPDSDTFTATVEAVAVPVPPTFTLDDQIVGSGGNPAALDVTFSDNGGTDDIDLYVVTTTSATLQSKADIEAGTGGAIVEGQSNFGYTGTQVALTGFTDDSTPTHIQAFAKQRVDGGESAVSVIPVVGLDFTVPGFASAATSDANTVVVTFNDDVVGTGVPGNWAFDIGGSAATITNVAIAGTAATLTCSETILGGEVLDALAYSGGNLTDESGNALGNISGQTITNNEVGGGGITDPDDKAGLFAWMDPTANVTANLGRCFPLGQDKRFKPERIHRRRGKPAHGRHADQRA